MLPIKKCLEGNFFTKSNLDSGETVYKPCGSNDNGAVEINWMDIPQGCFDFLPMTTMEDAIAVLRNSSPSVTSKAIEKVESFARDRNGLESKISTMENENENTFIQIIWDFLAACF